MLDYSKPTYGTSTNPLYTLVRMSTPYSTRLPVGNKDFTNATVVIIGAGISGRLTIRNLPLHCLLTRRKGMCMAIDLIKRNHCHNFVILEKSSSVGGTWSDNKYPGCCCDGMRPFQIEIFRVWELMQCSVELTVQLLV